MSENQKSPSPYKKNPARPEARGRTSISREELERNWKEEASFSEEEEGRGIAGKILAVVGILLVAALAVFAVFFFRNRQKPSGTEQVAKTEAAEAADPGTGADNSREAAASGEENTDAEDGGLLGSVKGLFEKEEEGELIEMVESPVGAFLPHSVETTEPSRYIASTGISVNDAILEDTSSYTTEAPIRFGLGEEYTDLPGIFTFRGNNFRNNPTYGHAAITANKMTELWQVPTGSITYGNATWSGSGWTGQPLMRKWTKEAKAHMNMEQWAKEDDELVEVIYACMDGYVYFLDLRDGKRTREPLYLGFTFKGAGALDPRGYPIMYLGAGYDSNNGTARAFIINLIDCSVMYTFGNNDPYSLRGSLSFFDSSALVDAETDTLIYPGENGILYLFHLNTVYDEEKGLLSIDPDRIVKWRYNGVRSDVYSYWLGMEDSAAIYDKYLYIADNGANLMCIDLDTLQLVWAQDILDDSNSTPVLSVEDRHLYLYVSTSFHLGWRSSTSAEIPIWKIDAETGEIVWQTSYECYTEDGVSGGVQSTIAVGDHSLGDHIYVTVARTGSQYGGVLACINKKTGAVEWEQSDFYSWSSPVCVYDEEGKGKVIYCTGGGKIHILNVDTGEILDTFSTGEGVIEASPAVYDNYLVVGTRDCRIYGIRLE